MNASPPASTQRLNTSLQPIGVVFSIVSGRSYGSADSAASTLPMFESWPQRNVNCRPSRFSSDSISCSSGCATFAATSGVVNSTF